jgi:hypothetical protein
MSTDIAEQLREWATGSYPLEAAVELLIRAHGGRFTDPSHPWVDRIGADRAWLAADQIDPESTGALSGGEQRLLAIVGSLADGLPVDLHHALPGLDRPTLDLVLAALAHAGGSHQHGWVDIDYESRVIIRHGTHQALHPWPTSSSCDYDGGDRS